MILAFTRGETPSWDITCERNGAVVNLTGASASFAVKKNPNDAAALLTHSTADGGIVLSAPLVGICSLFLSAADTMLFDAGEKYVWDLKITEQNGTKTVVAKGNLLANQEIAD